MTTIPRILSASLVALSVAACSGAAAKDAPAQDSPAATSAQPIVQPTVQPKAPRAAPALRVLASGTRIEANLEEGLSSRTNKAGEALHATVSTDVLDSRGRTLIPAGSIVTLTIVELQPSRDRQQKGRLTIAVNSVTVGTGSFPVVATLDPVHFTLKGRGVTGDQVAKVGVGTAAGAIVGQLIGKNTKSTVIGGAVGAAAGTVVAVELADRDVVVAAGTAIVFTLTQSLTMPAR